MAGTQGSVAQLNIRMASATKAAGDATLERMDILPAQLIRAVWQKLALGEEAAVQLLRALVQKPAVGEGLSVVTSWDEFERNREQREAFWSEIEAVAGPMPAPLSEEEMEELIYQEHLDRERERLVGYAD